MQTNTDEIEDRIERLSTCAPDAAPGGFTFNQFLIEAGEPLLFHRVRRDERISRRRLRPYDQEGLTGKEPT
jgi:hypothetical protein